MDIMKKRAMSPLFVASKARSYKSPGRGGVYPVSGMFDAWMASRQAPQGCARVSASGPGKGYTVPRPGIVAPKPNIATFAAHTKITLLKECRADDADAEALDDQFLAAQIDLDGLETGVFGQQRDAVPVTPEALDRHLVLDARDHDLIPERLA